MFGTIIRGNGDTRPFRVSRSRGSALVPALLVVSALTTLSLALLTTGLDGARNVNFESDDYRVNSAIETVVGLAANEIWTDYLDYNDGPGPIESFQSYLDLIGVGAAGEDGTVSVDESVDWTPHLNIPYNQQGQVEYNGVSIERLELVREDDFESTRLFFRAEASAQRGESFANQILTRAVQILFTIEPGEFTGFEYAMLGNNVNCIFCHTKVDSVERYFNPSKDEFGSFDRVKVASLESLMLRHNKDGKTSVINDWDADSRIAGTLYVRGTAIDQDHQPISDWGDLSLGGYEFDQLGKLVQGVDGSMNSVDLSPSGFPMGAMENLYLDYPKQYSQMVDGALPNNFPPPIPDNGGIDPATGMPISSGAGNHIVDEGEFFALAQGMTGSISGGNISELQFGKVIDEANEVSELFAGGNSQGLGSVTDGNTVLIGTIDKPIELNGDVAIAGDVIVSGYVLGEGTITASGNVYIPTDLQYLDGADSDGFRTFGVSDSGSKNSLGLAAGGNIIVGDYLRPAWLRESFSADDPAKYEIIDGTPEGKWSFTLAEISIFNRSEWAKTLKFLPAPGEADLDPSVWSVPNPDYAKYNGSEPYLPRYYNFGPDDEIPIFNKGEVGFDVTTGTWTGDEVPSAWSEDDLTILDPNDPDNQLLYNSDGTPKATVLSMAPETGWISDEMYKQLLEITEDNRTWGEPMKIDGLLYTNNALMALVNRLTPYEGQMVLNGALVSADLGMLVPSRQSKGTAGTAANMPNSDFKIGLQLNYDQRIKDALNVTNPFEVTMSRTLWNPIVSIN